MRCFAWLLLLVSLSSCSGEQAVAAGVTTAAAVAAAAINRAATKECWGTCTHGYICDPDSGRCVLPEELDRAARPEEDEEWDDGCIEEVDGRVVCPNDPETWATVPHPQGVGGADGASASEGGCGGSGGCEP